MSNKIDPNSFYHQDPAYGLNDWEAAVAFVRAMLENSEHVDFCWPRVRQRVMANNTLLSQTFVQHLGRMRDARAVDIIIEKLGTIDQSNKTLPSPWCPEVQYLELLSLEALSKVGGNKAKERLKISSIILKNNIYRKRRKNSRSQNHPGKNWRPCPKTSPIY